MTRLPRLDWKSNWAFLVAGVLLAGIGAASIAEALTNWNLLDMSAYRDAALRLRSGEVLYGGDVHLNSAYRYAPWFAYAWVPLTHLPEPVLRIAWSLLLLLGSWMALRPLVRASRANILLLILFGPLLLGTTSGGNVQPIMIGVLVAGLSTRFGWLAVGFAASLKIIPLAFCAVFIAQRRWTQLAGCLVLTALLWMPVVWMTLEPITFETGLARVLPTPLWILIPLAGATVALWFAARQSRYTPLAAALAAVLALPRLFVYEIAILLPATARPPIDGKEKERME